MTAGAEDIGVCSFRATRKHRDIQQVRITARIRIYRSFAHRHERFVIFKRVWTPCNYINGDLKKESSHVYFFLDAEQQPIPSNHFWHLFSITADRTRLIGYCYCCPNREVNRMPQMHLCSNLCTIRTLRHIGTWTSGTWPNKTDQTSD